MGFDCFMMIEGDPSHEALVDLLFRLPAKLAAFAFRHMTFESHHEPDRSPQCIRLLELRARLYEDRETIVNPSILSFD
jgi:hypothetical protein